MPTINQKKIRAIAKMLPTTSYATSEYQEISGEDLLLSGNKEVGGKPVESEKTYSMRVPVLNEENHYRRMKRAFRASGSEGIKRYLKRFVEDYGATCKTIDIIFPKEGSKAF